MAGMFERRVSRRDLFRKAGAGIGMMAAGRHLLSGTASAAAKASAEPLMIAHVKVRSAAQGRLLSLFDDTHARPSSDTVELLLWPGDLARLHELGFRNVKIVVDDVVAADAAAAREAGGATSTLAAPGPNFNDYRRLSNYETELQQMPRTYPYQARLIAMQEKTLEGRTVYGVEIAGNVHAIDGRPTAYVDGIHHAREWPAGEYPIYFAHHLLEGYGKDVRITQLLDKVRVIVVPIQNPDGFHHSRESALQISTLGIVLGGQEGYWRKNKRGAVSEEASGLGQNPGSWGVDTNRNYPFLWGATTGGLVGGVPAYASTSPNPYDQTYYGADALSEPENRNVAQLLLSRNVTAMVTNHTSGRLVLRPWGHTAEPTADEDLMAALGGQMAAAMGGYTNQIGLGLYPTTGTTDDWLYAAAAAIGYTFEHNTAFHPSYTSGVNAVKNFWPRAVEAFMLLCEAAADPANHCVIRARTVDITQGAEPVPVVSSLNLHKEFDTPTWEQGVTGIGPLLNQETGTHEVIDLHSASALDGSIEWHVNPSTRPLEAAANRTETVRLRISAPGYQLVTQDVSFRRGDVLDLGDIALQPIS